MLSLRTLLIANGCLAAGLFIRSVQAQYRDDLPPPPPVVAERTVVVDRDPVEVSVAGQVLRTKQVDDRVTNEKVLAAQLELGNGQKQIVDLGPTRIYKNAPIYAGDQIAVFGQQVRLGNANVVLATKVHVGGEAVTVPRFGPAPPAGYVVTELELKIYGRIDAMKPARLRDSRAEHLIARIVDRNGDAVVVDLGPRGALWRADLRSGDWVTIYGQQMQIGDQPVILARELNKAGAPVFIERELIPETPVPAAVVTQRVVAP